MSLLPEDTTGYSRNATIEATAPSKTVVEVEDGKWSFKGFDKESVTATMENADNDGNVKFVGYWEYARNEAKAPQTGDNSNLALWIALLFISGGAITLTALASKKRKYN